MSVLEIFVGSFLCLCNAIFLIWIIYGDSKDLRCSQAARARSRRATDAYWRAKFSIAKWWRGTVRATKSATTSGRDTRYEDEGAQSFEGHEPEGSHESDSAD